MALEYPNPQDHKWFTTLSALAGQASDPLILPRFAIDLLAVVVPGGGGTAYLEYCADDPVAVDANPSSASWVTWDPGAISANTGGTSPGSATAVRLQAVTADATCKLSANFAT